MENPLIHFTGKSALIGILKTGFALMPCDRRLLDDLFGTNRPFEGDPQNFGMVCFTEAPLNKSKEIRKKGDYGIAVKMEWALDKGIRKVKYLGRSETHLLREKYKRAIRQMQNAIRFPDDEGLKLAFKNKEFAAFLGAPAYAALLDEYEYSQTLRDEKQMEWRITQHHPFYNAEPGVVPSAEGWGGILFYVKFDLQDVAYLVSPSGKHKELRRDLPRKFRQLEIRTVDPVG